MEGSETPRAAQAISTVVLAFAVTFELNTDITKFERVHSIKFILCNRCQVFLYKIQYPLH